MNSTEFENLLARYLMARIPFVAVNTTERSRVLELIRKVADATRLPVYVHTLSEGMYEILQARTANEGRTVYEAVDFISQQIRQRENLTFVMTEVSSLDDDSDNARQFYDLVALAEKHAATIIVITSKPVWSQLMRLGMAMTLDFPDEQEMHTIIRESIEPYIRDIRVEWDDADYREAASILAGISRIEAQNVIATLIAKREVSKSDLNDVRYAKDRIFTNIAGLEKIDIRPDELSVGGLAGLRAWLSEKQKLLAPSKRDALRAKAIPMPRGILLVGVPGCGKSLSAKAISATWRMPLYRLDFATVQGMYVGQSENRFKEALATAEHVSPCILWIDEIEKGLSGAGSGSSSGVTDRLVGQFLFWLQECRKMVFVVATANNVTLLPAELLRRGRFDELFFVDLPTDEERKEIISLYTHRFLGIDCPTQLMDELVKASEGFAGSDIESAVREVAYRLVANDGLQFSEEHLKTSFQNVVPLSATSPERVEAIRAWGRERAVPASGHAIGGRELSTEKPRRRVLL
jgi:ATP-dependent 26S proteasome regulatory subunit